MRNGKIFFNVTFSSSFRCISEKRGGREFVNKVTLRRNWLELLMRSMESWKMREISFPSQWLSWLLAQQIQLYVSVNTHTHTHSYRHTHTQTHSQAESTLIYPTGSRQFRESCSYSAGISVCVLSNAALSLSLFLSACLPLSLAFSLSLLLSAPEFISVQLWSFMSVTFRSKTCRQSSYLILRLLSFSVFRGLESKYNDSENVPPSLSLADWSVWSCTSLLHTITLFLI